MASSRKTGNVNKNSTAANNAVAKKEEEDVKINQKRRRLEDMLGSQWSDNEIQHFYDAYRKYGMNWKKVAAAVRSRSVEMVEALYSMNKAYLSLPEGTASVAGLIAMVTDYYCVMEKSGSEQESNEGRDRGPQRALKRKRRKYRNSSFKDVDIHLSERSPSPFVGSSSDCLSLLKAGRPGGEARVVGKRTPRVLVAHPSEKGIGCKFSGLPDHKSKIDADDHIAHEIALAMTKASQKDKTPRVTLSSITSHLKVGNVLPQVKNDNKMQFTPGMTSAQLRGSVRDEQNHERNWQQINMRDGERVGTVDSLIRGKRYYGNTAISETGNVFCDDMKESCSGTELYNKFKLENSKQLFSKSPKKHSKKIRFDEDEIDAFEALNTLADLSLTLPETFLDNDNQGADINTSSTKWKGKNFFGGNDDAAIKCDSSSKVGNVGTVPESYDKIGVRKRRTSPYCDPEEMNKSTSKGRHYRKEGDLHKSTRLVTSEIEGNSPSTKRNKRKRDLSKSLNHMYTNFREQVEIGRSVDGICNLKAKLGNCLSWRKAQRWCTFEWFYSSIDYPWFARREFVEYLDFVGLGHIPRLTRVEWGVIRSSLGKPRRFSRQFLKEEKEKLNQYRECVRNHYTELRLGAREGLPTDLARPLSVGQRVIAIDPKTREIHDGSVLTVDRSRCRIQFDKPDLGVEFVMDIDCMPLYPLENMPASLAINKLSENHLGLNLNRFAGHNSSVQFTLNENNDNPEGPLLRVMSESLVEKLTKPVKDDMTSTNAQTNVRSSRPTNNEHLAVPDQPSFPTQAKEADVKPLYELTCALNKKEAIVSELQHMNDVVEEHKKKDSSFEVPEHFSKRYASVLVQLDEVKDEVSSALHSLRQKNTSQGNFGLATVKPVLCDTSGQETLVTEIVDSSRNKAQKMVSVAIQAMSSLRNTKNDGVEEATDFLNNQLSKEVFCQSAVRSSPISSTPDEHTIHANRVADKHNNSPVSNAEIPSELIANCVATLFMIQKCTEREFPPADVAQILDYAVSSLQPCSSQNLPIYSEIQKCMGIIRSQILALIRA